MKKWRTTGDIIYCDASYEAVFEAENLEQAEKIAFEIAMKNADDYEYLVFGFGYTVEDYMEEHNVTREIAEKEMKEAYDDYRANVEWGFEEILDEEYISYF